MNLASDRAADDRQRNKQVLKYQELINFTVNWECWWRCDRKFILASMVLVQKMLSATEDEIQYLKPYQYQPTTKVTKDYPNLMASSHLFVCT